MGLMLTMAYASQNMRLIRQWYHKQGKQTARQHKPGISYTTSVLWILRAIVHATPPWMTPGTDPPT